MKCYFTPILLSVLAIGNHAAAIGIDRVKRDTVQGTATVDLAAPSGAPSHLASGFLYGIPDRQNQVPDHFYRDMGFKYGRNGGAQLPAPARGWVFGVNEFNNRFASALSNYQTIRKQGGRMQVLPADLWGADGTPNLTMPGDDGDWTSYDNFLTALIDGITSNDMVPGLVLEIWNEPDLVDVFWQRNQTQYLQMWGRAYHRLRAELPSSPIVGPSSAGAPTATNTWLQDYYQFIKVNDSIPDIYAWHLEANTSDPNDDLQTNVPAQAALLSQYGLPTRTMMINEYATKPEQQPGGAAWWISRLERYNIQGLRGNWASVFELHDYFAGLLGKPNAGTSAYNATQAGYWGNGEYNVYKYYATAMTGERVQTTGSSDRQFDLYATSSGAGNSSVKILCGSRLDAGTWDILVTGLGRAGIGTNSSVSAHTYQFDYTGGQFGNVPAPVDPGVQVHTSSNDQLVLRVSPDGTNAYAFELS